MYSDSSENSVLSQTLGQNLPIFSDFEASKENYHTQTVMTLSEVKQPLETQ